MRLLREDAVKTSPRGGHLQIPGRYAAPFNVTCECTVRYALIHCLCESELVVQPKRYRRIWDGRHSEFKGSLTIPVAVLEASVALMERNAFNFTMAMFSPSVQAASGWWFFPRVIALPRTCLVYLHLKHAILRRSHGTDPDPRISRSCMHVFLHSSHLRN